MFKKKDDWLTETGSLWYSEKEDTGNEQISFNVLYLNSPQNNLSPNSSFCTGNFTPQSNTSSMCSQINEEHLCTKDPLVY